MPIDIKKEMKQFYQPPLTPVLVDVPEMQFIMSTGEGHPDSDSFQQTIEALYSVAYTIKFALKKQGTSNEYVVPPLEGLWWTAGESEFNLEDKNNWAWTLMIMQPDFITQEVFETAVSEVRKKKNPERLDLVTFEKFHEGLSVQLMHIGPYAEEPPSIVKLHTFAAESGFILHGKHHEIYLGDPRKTAPEKLKTVLRQPVTK
jgi:hypothetical protein